MRQIGATARLGFQISNELDGGDLGFASVAEELSSEGSFDPKGLEDARDRALRGNSGTATQEQFGADYPEAGEISARQDIDPFLP